MGEDEAGGDAEEEDGEEDHRIDHLISSRCDFALQLLAIFFYNKSTCEKQGGPPLFLPHMVAGASLELGPGPIEFFE